MGRVEWAVSRRLRPSIQIATSSSACHRALAHCDRPTRKSWTPTCPSPTKTRPVSTQSKQAAQSSFTKRWPRAPATQTRPYSTQPIPVLFTHALLEHQHALLLCCSNAKTPLLQYNLYPLFMRTPSSNENTPFSNVYTPFSNATKPVHICIYIYIYNPT